MDWRVNTIILPIEVPSQNTRERWHWSRQRREVANWSSAASIAARRIGMPAIGQRKAYVQIRSFRRRRITDRANLIGGCKGLIDGLVRARLIVDDAEAWMIADYDQYLLSDPSNPRPGQPCTMVSIYPIGNAAH